MGITITNEYLEASFNLAGIGFSLSTDDGGTLGIDIGIIGVEMNSEGGGKISYLWDTFEIEVAKDGCSYVKDTYVMGIYSFTEVQEIPDCREDQEEEESRFKEGVEYLENGSIVINERLDDPNDSQFDPRDFTRDCGETIVGSQPYWKAQPGQYVSYWSGMPDDMIVGLGSRLGIFVDSVLGYSSRSVIRDLRKVERVKDYFVIDSSVHRSSGSLYVLYQRYYSTTYTYNIRTREITARNSVLPPEGEFSRSLPFLFLTSRETTPPPTFYGIKYTIQPGVNYSRLFDPRNPDRRYFLVPPLSSNFRRVENCNLKSRGAGRYDKNPKSLNKPPTNTKTFDEHMNTKCCFTEDDRALLILTTLATGALSFPGKLGLKIEDNQVNLSSKFPLKEQDRIEGHETQINSLVDINAWNIGNILTKLTENNLALGAEEILTKGFKYPNKWIAPRGKGKSKASNYLQLFELLTKMLDHFGIHPCEPTLADLNPAKPGNQTWGIKTNNATHAIKLLLEYVKETDGDQAAGLNLDLRSSVLLGQLFIMVSSVAESQLSLFQALGLEVKEEIDYIDNFPFDYTLGAEKQDTSGKGFGQEALAKAAAEMEKEHQKILEELAGNDEKGTEAVLERFLQVRKKQPFVYNKVTTSKSLLEALRNVQSK